MEFWKQSIEQNATYKMKMIPYVEYWENILLDLSKSLFFEVPLLWKAFSLKAIGDLIMLRLCCHPQWKLLI
jgi:hypothetical protein